MGQLDEKIEKKVKTPIYEEDYRLAQMAAAGDSEAWRMLCEGAYHKIRRYALKWDQQYGEVAVSRAFLVGYRKITGFRGESAFSGWIWGIVKIQLKKIYGENERDRRLKARLAMSWEWCGYDDPLDIVIRNERNICLWRAFYSLPELHQNLVECRVLRGEKIKEASMHSGVRWTKGRLEYDRALQKLKHRFVCLYSGRKLQ